MLKGLMESVHIDRVRAHANQIAFRKKWGGAGWGCDCLAQTTNVIN